MENVCRIKKNQMEILELKITVTKGKKSIDNNNKY